MRKHAEEGRLRRGDVLENLKKTFSDDVMQDLSARVSRSSRTAR